MQSNGRWAHRLVNWERLVVVGAGGHAKVVISAAWEAGYSVEAVYDDDPEKWGKSLFGVPVRGAIDLLAQGPPVPAIIAIGDLAAREQLAARLDLAWTSIIHPHSYVDVSARIGAGTIICAGAIVQPDATIGVHGIVNTGATVDHDCRLGDYVHIAPGAHLAGGVRIGDGAFVGIGATAIPGVSIGPRAIVGAGAVVIRDLPGGVTAVGCPARIMKPSRS
jgi:sugar O-acyltransferase (sialic acid O-acetyltransferase NeuD family)